MPRDGSRQQQIVPLKTEAAELRSAAKAQLNLKRLDMFQKAALQVFFFEFFLFFFATTLSMFAPYRKRTLASAR